MQPACLIIRDGWGRNDNPLGNAVMAAKKPYVDSLLEKYPWTLLDASGEPVGLPDGYQGSSEVGHLNMGAGRIVIQELKRIDDGLRDGSFFRLPKWEEMMNQWRSAPRSTLHFLGLLQDEGVHAHQEHLFKLMRQARQENPSGAIVVHPFLDGRDTPPRSAPEFLARLNLVLADVGNARIGTMMGRYYGMDRSRDWDLTDQAYRALTQGEGRPFKEAIPAVEQSWAQDKTPDNFDMVDEYIPPLVAEGFQGMKDGDCVIHTNFRQDRAIQLTQAFLDPNYPGHLACKAKVKYLGLTRYYDELTEYLLGPMGGDEGLPKLLGEVVSAEGLRQLRLAETQKFRHVTSFFNGKSTKPFAHEDQVEIKGRFDPATFASHPEMEAWNLTDKFLDELLPKEYPLIVINYANCDMVGHTGVLEAATRAVEVVDECLSRIIPAMLARGYHILVSADHGNAEEMIDYQTGLVKTSHTTFPVECIYVAENPVAGLTRERGKLSDLAPTLLKLMDIAVPAEMTAENLLK